MYTAEQKRALLALARRAVEERVANRKPSPPDTGEPELRKARGAFVTLKMDGDLRGCIGFPEAIYPLEEAVVRAAVAAACHDPRFLPVSPAEVGQIRVEISVLSPPLPVAAEDVVVGRHGLIAERDGARGLLLPQVPLEWGWDRTEFLEHTCRKAGLPADAWKTGATLYAFTAEVFSEGDGAGTLSDGTEGGDEG